MSETANPLARSQFLAAMNKPLVLHQHQDQHLGDDHPQKHHQRIDRGIAVGPGTVAWSAWGFVDSGEILQLSSETSDQLGEHVAKTASRPGHGRSIVGVWLTVAMNKPPLPHIFDVAKIFTHRQRNARHSTAPKVADLEGYSGGIRNSETPCRIPVVGSCE